jgi:hypothetical protein
MTNRLLALCTALLIGAAALAADDVEKLPSAKLPKLTPPAKVAHDQAPLKVKVLVLEFNPLIPGKVYAPDQPDAQPKGLREVAGWNDPLPLAAGYMQDICDASGGVVQFEIVEWQVVRRFQQKTDGYVYTPEAYMTALKQGTRKAEAWHKPDGTDYPRTIQEFEIAKRVDSGEIDEVWMMGLPYFGYWESCMAGPQAFEVNGATYPDVPVKRRFVIMGFNVERGVAEMLEDQCHRTEATMSRIYGGWHVDKLTSAWARFAANQKQSGTAAVGTAHYPPNGVRDYDYQNEASVESTADDWLDYPNLTGAKKRTFNREEWAGPHKKKSGEADYHRNYLRWWFTHLPKAPEVNKEDGRLNNWWQYVYNFNAYDERGKAVPGK